MDCFRNKTGLQPNIFFKELKSNQKNDDTKKVSYFFDFIDFKGMYCHFQMSLSTIQEKKDDIRLAH